MKSLELKPELAFAVDAAQAAGYLMRRHLPSPKQIKAMADHDIKLELDERCQKLIEKQLRLAFPRIALLGEEGVAGDPQAPMRWVVDPIDGTVNFAYGIPHACVSIALQSRSPSWRPAGSSVADYQTILGVVYDPFRQELWTAIQGHSARLNGKIIRASTRSKLKDAIISLGFAKHKDGLRKMLPKFQHLVHRVRKIRILGSAALDLAYVASGRIDAYLESGVRLWDIAAGGFILERAGGEFWRQPIAGDHTYHVVATNGRLRRRIERLD
jgi:myo-inositol-1(or 4)-monophosphatase